MAIFGSEWFHWIWMGLGTILCFFGLMEMWKSAKLSLERSKGSNAWAKLYSVLDEIGFAILFIGGTVFLFYMNTPVDMITVVGRLFSWFVDFFILPILRFFNVPV